MTVAQPLSSFDRSALPPHPVRRWMRSGNSGVSGGTGGSEKAGFMVNGVNECKNIDTTRSIIKTTEHKVR